MSSRSRIVVSLLNCLYVVSRCPFSLRSGSSHPRSTSSLRSGRPRGSGLLGGGGGMRLVTEASPLSVVSSHNAVVREKPSEFEP